MKRQGITGTLILYFGVVLGFINSTLLFPKLLGADIFGFVQTLSFTNNLLITLVLLGLPGAVIRFYPYFREEKRSRDAFFTLVMLLGGMAIVGGGILLYLFKWELIGLIRDPASREIARQYFHLVFFNLLTYTLISILESFNTARERPLFPLFLTQVLSRLLTTLLIALYALDFLDLKGFLDLYGIKGLVNIILLVAHQEWRGRLGYASPLVMFHSPHFRAILTYSLFILFTGMSNSLIAYIDMVMVSGYLDFSQAGIYAVFYFLSTMIAMPANAFGAVISPRIAALWKEGDLAGIGKLNRHTTRNVLVIGMLVFAGICGNQHNVVKVLGEPYRAGVPVGLFLGIAQIGSLAFGFSSLVLIHSGKYRFDLLAKTLMAGLTIGSNYLFIKLYGLPGAAMATAGTVLLTGTGYMLFNYINWRIHPFTISHLKIALAGLLAWVSVYYLPVYPRAYVDLAYRAPLMVLVYGMVIYLSGVLPEANAQLRSRLRVLLQG